jgi:hypothetical protein
VGRAREPEVWALNPVQNEIVYWLTELGVWYDIGQFSWQKSQQIWQIHHIIGAGYYYTIKTQATRTGCDIFFKLSISGKSFMLKGTRVTQWVR